MQIIQTSFHYSLEKMSLIKRGGHQKMRLRCCVFYQGHSSYLLRVPGWTCGGTFHFAPRGDRPLCGEQMAKINLIFQNWIENSHQVNQRILVNDSVITTTFHRKYAFAKQQHKIKYNLSRSQPVKQEFEVSP